MSCSAGHRLPFEFATIASQITLELLITMHPIVSYWFAVAIAGPAASHALDLSAAGRPADAQRSMSTASTVATKDTAAMPATVAMPDAGRDQLAHLFAQVGAVLADKSPLSENDAIFGAGKFFWPKDPRRPAMTMISYAPERADLHKVFLAFKRDSSRGPWTSAEIVVLPRGFPLTAYRMDLPRSFFAGFRLDKRYVRHAPDEEVSIVNVFEYSRRTGHGAPRLLVEARPDVSGTDSEFPGSFHKIILSHSHKHELLLD